MWNPTKPTEKKQNNTATTTTGDNKKKEEVAIDDCSCSSAQQQSQQQQQQQQQLQQLNILEQANSKNPNTTSTTIGGNLSSAETGVGATDTEAKTKSLSKSHDQDYLTTETADSGFISGPQSEPMYGDEEEEVDDETADTTKTKSSPKDKEDKDVEIGAVGDISAKIQNLNEEQHRPQDSGCIDEVEDEDEDEDNDDDVHEREHETETAAAVTETEVVATEAKNIAAEAITQQLQQATSKGATSSNTTTIDDQMKFKHNVDAGMSEWMCQLNSADATNTANTSLNNLSDSCSGRKAISTKVLTKTVNVSKQQQQPQTPTATAPNAAIPPWEQFYQQNDDGDTPLHLACISGFTDVVAALIRMVPHPCLLNIQNDEAQTPLHLATLTQHPNLCRMLLLAGAEPTIRDRHGNTALHLACIAGEKQCVRSLTETFGASEIHEAHRQYGHRTNDKAVSQLSYARLPSDLEICNYDGERCVHLAAQGGHIDILRILVSHGADINAREGKSGRSPLHIAIECRNEDLANFLLDECEKLNLETATYAGLTAYQVAQILDNSQMKDILEKRGAEPLTPPDSDYDYDSDIEDLDDTKLYDRFGDPKYFINYGGGVNPMTVA